MLRITIPPRSSVEAWDEKNEVFVTIPGSKGYELQLEHSLVSLHKWESKWCKPFLTDKPMTEEETLDYIRCMTLTQNVPDEAYDRITSDSIDKISEYIKAPMTATWFSKEEVGKKGRGEVVTAEIIYYWMISLGIPQEYQKWHLNSLLTLIKVCSVKNSPKKKKGAKATASYYAALNAARRKELNSNG